MCFLNAVFAGELRARSGHGSEVGFGTLHPVGDIFVMTDVKHRSSFACCCEPCRGNTAMAQGNPTPRPSSVSACPALLMSSHKSCIR